MKKLLILPFLVLGLTACQTTSGGNGVDISSILAGVRLSCQIALDARDILALVNTGAFDATQLVEKICNQFRQTAARRSGAHGRPLAILVNGHVVRGQFTGR